MIARPRPRSDHDLDLNLDLDLNHRARLRHVGVLINFLVLMTLLFGGLAQTRSVSPRIAWPLAIGCAAVAMVLAIIRYSRSKRQ